MPENNNNESAEERESRHLLNTFVTVTDPVLERLFKGLIGESVRLDHDAAEPLRRMWDSARENLRGVSRTIQIGLSRTRRSALLQVGMFGDALAAKWELLSLDIRAGAVRRVLKRMNSMLSSLSKVFPALHAVKEFKDHVEATIEGMQDMPEFIDLKDVLPR